MKVHHIQCPECARLGKDTSKDNLAVYPDGGSFCFACGHGEVGDRFIPNDPEQFAKQEYREFHRASFSLLVKDKLKEFITEDEIARHFIYDFSHGRAVLLDTLPNFYWGKSWYREPKVMTSGQVPLHIFTSKTDDEARDDTLVIVEDPVSAIVVSRAYHCLPLFGAHLPPRWLRMMAMLHFQEVVFWLDKDKEKQSVEYAMSLRKVFKTRYVVTDKDPKCYTKNEVESVVSLQLTPSIS